MPGSNTAQDFPSRRTSENPVKRKSNFAEFFFHALA
jgi:hypothetical protein